MLDLYDEEVPGDYEKDFPHPAEAIFKLVRKRLR